MIEKNLQVSVALANWPKKKMLCRLNNYDCFPHKIIVGLHDYLFIYLLKHIYTA